MIITPLDKKNLPTQSITFWRDSSLRTRAIKAFGDPNYASLNNIQWTSFRLRKGIFLRSVGGHTATKFNWYHRILKGLREFFSDNTSYTKIAALKAWHNPKKLQEAADWINSK